MKVTLSVLLMLLLASPCFAGLHPHDAAPSFSLRNKDGKTVTLNDVLAEKKGSSRGVVLSFFASWCVSCRKELPLINAQTDDLNRKGIIVVIVDVKEDFDTINALLTELKVDRPIVLSDQYGKAAERYNVRFLPATFFIKADGSVADIIYGEIEDAAELNSSAEKIMH